MLSVFVYLIELLICFLLQNTVFSALNIGGIVPDLIVILIVSIGYQKGKLYGMWMGMFAGFILDLTFGSLLGVYALVYMFIGYGCGFFTKYYIRYDTIFPLSIIAVSEFICTVYGYVVNLLIHRRFDIFYYIRRLMFPKVCYTVLVAIIAYKLFDFIYMHVLMPTDEDE